MKTLLLFLGLFVTTAQSATVRLYFTDPLTNEKDTNAFYITPVGTNVLSNGGVVGRGVTTRYVPASDGYRTNTLAVGHYSVTNRSLGSGVVIRVPESSSLYDYTNLLISGYNTFVTIGATQTNISYASVTNLTSFGALTNNETRAVTLQSSLTLDTLVANSNNVGGGAFTVSPYGDVRARSFRDTSGRGMANGGLFTGDGSGLTNLTSSSGLVDYDAGLYLAAVGKTNSQHAARADGGFKALKEFNLWTNLIDGAVLGTNLNLSGSYWRTLKLNYGTNVNNPTVLDYGLQFHGTNRAYIRNLSDMRTNTILVCYQSIGNFDVADTNAIFAAQNSSSSNGSVATFVYPYVGSPTYAAHPLHHFVGQNISGGEATSNAFTAFTATSVSGRHMDEFYVSIGVSNGVRTATINGYGAALTNTTFSLSSGITSFNLGAFLAGDSGAPTTGMFKGTVKAFLIFNQMLTTNEVRQAIKALRWFDVRENNYIFVGDSLTQAYDDSYDTSSFSTNNWPWLFMNTSANSNRYFFRNWAAGGRSATTFGTDDYTNKVQVFSPGGAVKKSILMYRLGANDILQYASVNNSFQAARNFWSVANRDGFTIEVMNVTPLTNAFGFTNDYNRVEFNRGLETNAQYFSKLWPVSDLFPYINTNTQYSYDGVHPMYAANRAIADWLTCGGSSVTTTGALQRFSGTIKADAFWGDGTLLDFGEDVAFMRDDFFSGIATTANGDLNWATTGTVTARNTVYDTGRWGVLSLQSAATSGTAGQIYLSASGGGYLGTLPLATVVPWRAKFIIRPTNTNAVANVAGFAVPSAVWGATTHGIYVRADDTMDGGNWKFITRGSGGATTNDTGVVARTNSFVKFEFQGVTAGSVMLRVDGGAWITNSTTMPDAVSPIVSIVPRENVAKTNAIDFFEFVARPDR
jgi:lysophospholipase L1-like esterase